MFSEYASRFLAQSQSRIGFGRPPDESTRNPLARPRRNDQASASRFQSTRSYLQRPTLGGPGASITQFPFASRAGSTAPLFYSAHDDFPEEDDEEQHEREVADFYALQRSRRQFGGSRLEQSSEPESGGSSPRVNRGKASPGAKLAKETSHASSSTHEQLEDVGLDSVVPSVAGDNEGDGPPEDLAVEIPEDDPPSVQQFRKPPTMKPSFLPQETSPDEIEQRPYPPMSEASSALPTLAHPSESPPRHDAFWGNLYFISLAAMLASFVLAYLHTSAPSKKNPIGDTIYTTLHASYHLLAVDTVVAVLVSLLWLALLRSYVRPLVYTILVAVPVVLFTFFLYPLISSFKGSYDGKSVQDRAMRWFSFIPGILSLIWAFAVFKGRHSMGKAVDILEFSCRILAENPGLLGVGFGILGAVILWSWLWLAMFARIFLGGHFLRGAMMYVIGIGTWWLGVFFVFVYLWTLGVLSGIQRATTAATVSQWYFHRLTLPAPTSREVIQAAFNHASTTLFGTVCLSTLLAIAIRLPYLVLPRRFFALAGLCSYTVLPSTIATLTNPLTLTYSAIHSQPLVTSSRALAQLSFLPVTTRDDPRTATQFNARNMPSQVPLHSYTLALLLLRATRFITALGLGFGGWVSTARQLTLPSPGDSNITIKGSLYAYVVGLIAAAIGWGVMGAIDGVVAGIVDAVLVCYGSEVGRGAGEVRYCREAEWLFGDSTSTPGAAVRGGYTGADEEEARSFLPRGR